MPLPGFEELRKKMARDWDERACENAKYYVNTEQVEWDEDQFFQSGEMTVNEEIRTDFGNISPDRDPATLRVIEIGCGVGRVTRALSRVFGEVHAVDVSGEMIRQASENLAGIANVFLYQNNGQDLSVLPPVEYDFAFSSIVFQHIPSKAVIESYAREVSRLLRPGALFKFQIQGDPTTERDEDDTWLGVSWTDEEVVELAARTGFEPRYRVGEGTQYFWVWFFKPL
ncbi:MAG: class I SAM-dependent methyltransferase [Bryobacterales bacterium]|nr:class I SAM-dependent methyltransferase [Bryobacterales bacterium]